MRCVLRSSFLHDFHLLHNTRFRDREQKAKPEAACEFFCVHRLKAVNPRNIEDDTCVYQPYERYPARVLRYVLILLLQ